MTRSYSKLVASAVAALSLGAAAGCQAIAYPFIVFGEEPTVKVPAEYGKLAGKKVAIVVWADNETLMDYPFVRFEVASWVAQTLKAHAQNKKNKAAG